jgi:hypothetical protein
MKRSLRRIRNGKKNKFLFLVIFTVLAAMGSFLFYLHFFSNKPLFISPLASDNQSATFNLENLLLNSDIEFSTIVFRSPSTYLVKLRQDGEAIFSVNKDLKEQITSLQAVIKQLTIEGKRIIRIDFRFDKPVIELRD